MTAPTAPLPHPSGPGLPSILLVDDEVAILDGLRRQLRRQFTVHTATGGAAALELLRVEPVTVVVSDMRMPEMDGATFLSRVRVEHPDVVRILLTGQADTQAAISAVNEGNIYRFLTKPCPPEVLLDELGSAVELNRLVTAEKELMASTLRRTVEALASTLFLAQPAAFARADRITGTASELAEALGVEDAWEVEIVARLGSLGLVSVPPAVFAKAQSGRPLDDEEQAMLDRVPALSRDLVAPIPRLESVADAIGWQPARFDGAGSGPGVPAGAALPVASRIMKVAVDFHRGLSQRPSVADTIAVLRADEGAYDPVVLDALARSHELHDDATPVAPREVAVSDLEPGMVVFDDVSTVTGVLLVGRGAVVTEPLIQRLTNFLRNEPVARRLLVTGGAS
ncbi:HD domain-containing phosphohydrolase [Modestobacter sp. SYSU DS0657]